MQKQCYVIITTALQLAQEKGIVVRHIESHMAVVLFGSRDKDLLRDSARASHYCRTRLDSCPDPETQPIEGPLYEFYIHKKYQPTFVP